MLFGCLHNVFKLLCAIPSEGIHSLSATESNFLFPYFMMFWVLSLTRFCVVVARWMKMFHENFTLPSCALLHRETHNFGDISEEIACDCELSILWTLSDLMCMKTESRSLLESQTALWGVAKWWWCGGRARSYDCCMEEDAEGWKQVIKRNYFLFFSLCLSTFSLSRFHLKL